MSENLTWIAHIPSDWSVVPLKAVAQIIVSNVDKISEPSEREVRLCNYTDVYKNEQIDLTLEFMRSTATDQEIAKFALHVDDVLITKDSESWDDIAVPAVVSETAPDLLCGYHLALIRPDRLRVDGRYLFRCLQARPIRLQLELAASGITRFGLSKDDIGRMALPLPPLQSQRTVADKLDAEAERIDALIGEKEGMLTLLQEKHLAFASHAVTRGLDANVPMRPTDVGWLGDIPEHWSVQRAKQLFSVRDERSDTGEEELLTVSHLTGVTPRSEKTVSMFRAEDLLGYKRCYVGDLAINTLWAWMGAMGVAFQSGLVSPDYHVYKPLGPILPAYMDLLCRSKPLVAEVVSRSKGVWSSRLRLYPDAFLDIRVPVPPVEEQREIVAALHAENLSANRMKSELRLSISLLLERRSALISSAVTGQMEGMPT